MGHALERTVVGSYLSVKCMSLLLLIEGKVVLTTRVHSLDFSELRSLISTDSRVDWVARPLLRLRTSLGDVGD